jgi:hypothetical protein
MGLDRHRVKPPFIMQNGCVKDVCIMVTSMPVGLQNLVNPVKTVMGFDGRMYIPTSYANTLGYYPISGSGSGSGMPDSGGSGASGSGSGSGSGISGELDEPAVGPVFDKPKSKGRFRR